MRSDSPGPAQHTSVLIKPARLTRYEISYACPTCGIVGSAYADTTHGLMEGACTRGHGTIIDVRAGLDLHVRHHGAARVVAVAAEGQQR